MGGKLAVCEAEEQELGLPVPFSSPFSSSSSNAAGLEAVIGEFGNLRLEEKSEGGDHEFKENDENVILDKDSESLKEEKGEKFPFPLRPDEPDCWYYMKIGSCRYGLNCKFNHPPSRMKIKKAVNKNQKQNISECSGQTEFKVVEEKEKEVSPEMVGRTECKAVLGNETLSEKVGQAEHKAIKEKEKEAPSKRVGQAERKKAVNENQKENISECSGQTECKVIEEKEKETSSEMVGPTECKTVEGKQNETLSEKVGQAEHKAIKEKEKETPSKRVGQAERKAVKEKIKGTLSESIGKMECKYYSMPGGCKYGNACKYTHPVELNFLGLPMRPGERECHYYMRTGGCKYSTNCRFHHPDPTAVGGQDPLSGYQNGGSPQQHASPTQLPMTSWPMQRTPNEPMQRTPNEPVSFLDASPSYVPGFFLPPQGLHPNPEWNGYQAPVKPLFTEMNMQHPPSTSTMKDNTHKVNGSIPKKAQVGEYPERPGQAECQYFMKTGTCKFGSACRFRHPKSRRPKASGVDFSPMGLPLRPDQPVCTHYGRHRICKYGPSCRYNHPMDCNSSASAVADTESSQNISPDSSIESLQEVKIEGSTNAPILESEW